MTTATQERTTSTPTLAISVRRDRLAAPPSTLSSDLSLRAAYGDDPRWLPVLANGLRHQTIRIEATRDNETVGMLPLALVSSRLFGRFLVSLPYLNSAGVIAASDDVAIELIDRAVALAEEYDVRYLELRHEAKIEHPALTYERTDKVHMRLALPETSDELLASLKSKVRSQVKKSHTSGLEVNWGGTDKLDPFYKVFSRNMRDLGTPVYSKNLFRQILEQFGDDAELCIVRSGSRPAAAALLVHGDGVTQVPSASAIREFNRLNANMFLYWSLLERAIERGSRCFDFGRSSADSGTYKFKKQWGARPEPAVWQYYLRDGDADDMRPDSRKNQRRIAIWKKLPIWLTRLIGPAIVRGIP